MLLDDDLAWGLGKLIGLVGRSVGGRGRNSARGIGRKEGREEKEVVVQKKRARTKINRKGSAGWLASCQGVCARRTEGDSGQGKGMPDDAVGWIGWLVWLVVGGLAG